MQTRTHSSAVPFHSVFSPVLKQAEILVRALETRRAEPTEMEILAGLLETLPLASNEFGLACTRLSNAQRYLDLQYALPNLNPPPVHLNTSYLRWSDSLWALLSSRKMHRIINGFGVTCLFRALVANLFYGSTNSLRRYVRFGQYLEVSRATLKAATSDPSMNDFAKQCGSHIAVGFNPD